MDTTPIVGSGKVISARSSKPETLLTIYLAASFGALCLGLGDLLNNDRAATVLKLSEVMRRNFYPDAQSGGFGGLIALLLLVLLGAGFCWIHQPNSRIDAFSRGFSVFAILAVVAPYQGAPPQQAPSEPTRQVSVFGPLVDRNPSGYVFASAQISSDTAEPSAELDAQPVQSGSTVIRLKPFGDTPIPKTIVTIRDPETARILGYQAVAGDTFSISMPDGRYLLELEVPGYRRTNFTLNLGEGGLGYSVPMETSVFPLSLQRLFGSQEVKPEEFTPSPSIYRIGVHLSFR